jgi:hypothetical protein
MARRNEESKQGLIVALVICVIVAIGLAVGTYFGFAGQQELKDKAKKEQDAAKANAEARDWHRFQNELLKSYVGHSLTKEDKDHLLSQWSAYEGSSLGNKKDDNRPDFDNLKKQLDDRSLLGWDPAKKEPERTFLELVKQQREQIAKAEKDKAQADQTVARLNTEIQNSKKAHEEAEAGLRKELEKSNKDKSDLVAAYDAKFKEYLGNVEKLQGEVEDNKKSAANADEQAKKKVAEMERQKKAEIDKVRLGRDRDGLQALDVIDVDKAKGRVTNIEPGGQVVYVNLGSADNVQPQLTFSLYAEGSNLKSGRRKGAVEVTNVLQPHLSKARVTELADPNRNPVVRGDLIYNPSWSPSMRQHVAIAGIVDLSGEGTDDTEAFKRALERQNIVVDAWIKTRTPGLPVEGEMSLKTQFLILGDSAEFSDSEAAGIVAAQRQEKSGEKPSDRPLARKTELNEQIAKLRKQAQDLGVTVVPYRRFLAVTGFPLPRGQMTRSGVPYQDYSQLGGAGKKESSSKDKGDGDSSKEKEK